MKSAILFAQRPRTILPIAAARHAVAALHAPASRAARQAVDQAAVPTGRDEPEGLLGPGRRG
jgi:hypothetical protein